MPYYEDYYDDGYGEGRLRLPDNPRRVAQRAAYAKRRLASGLTYNKSSYKSGKKKAISKKKTIAEKKIIAKKIPKRSSSKLGSSGKTLKKKRPLNTYQKFVKAFFDDWYRTYKGEKPERGQVMRLAAEAWQDYKIGESSRAYEDAPKEMKHFQKRRYKRTGNTAHARKSRIAMGFGRYY